MNNLVQRAGLRLDARVRAVHVVHMNEQVALTLACTHGIEVLTGVKAGKEKKDGTFSANSVHFMVKARLRKLLEDGARLRRELSGDSDKNSGEED